MERPVVIVSMVCNNDRRSIGFAKEEERVNVAFSRAQELLIIVGSLDMFCLNGPSGRPYQNVASVVRKHNGILSLPGDELLAMP
jgi:superfamily I DNA and/or RNA helicase